VSSGQRIPQAPPQVLEKLRARVLANKVSRHRIGTQMAIAPENESCFQ
jgi:hypothetical protein